MEGPGHRRPAGGAAFAAALILAVQTFLMAFAWGIHASPVELDAFGNPLCSFHGTSGENGKSVPDRHGALPDCCAFGCQLASGSILSAAPTLAPLAEVSAARTLPRLEASFVAGIERSAIRSRGPPRLV
jgi:hypothetical protein